MAKWCLGLVPLLLAPASLQDPEIPPEREADSERAVALLLRWQAPDGSWGRDSIFGRDRNVRAAITRICLRALETARAPDRKAIQRARAFVRRHATERPARPSYQMYDFSFYSGAYALEYFAGHNPAEVAGFLETVRLGQRVNGGYSYAWRSRETDTYESFASALVALSLMSAGQEGVEFPDELLERTLVSIERAKLKGGFYGYHIVKGRARGSYSGSGVLALEGSLVRTVVCEYALLRADRGSKERLAKAVRDFFQHRKELEKVRARDEHTHQGKFDNAPYYFLFGHYYVAQALRELDRRTRHRGGRRLQEALTDIREENGAWFDSKICGRAYGTAMGVLVLDSISPREY